MSSNWSQWDGQRSPASEWKTWHPLINTAMEIDYQLIDWLCMTLYMCVCIRNYIGQMPVSHTVPNPEVLQATINWLHPVCIYGCFALLGLISAVHSRITQYFNAMFHLGRACIAYTYAWWSPWQAKHCIGLLSNCWHVGLSKENLYNSKCHTCWLQICHTSGLLIQLHFTLENTQYTHKNIHKHAQQAGTITYTRNLPILVDTKGWEPVREREIEWTLGAPFVQTISKRNRARQGFSTLQTLAKP